MRREIRDFNSFRKITQKKSTESKITEFGSRFAEKSTSKLGRNFQTRRERKTKIKIEINLIYDLKLKFNVIRRGIRRKKQILTQDSA